MFIVVFLIIVNVSTFYYVIATPVHYHKRANNKTNTIDKKIKDTSSQIVISDLDVEDLTFWSKYANAAYCDVTDWKCGAACDTKETKNTRLIKFFRNNPRGNNAYVAINDQEKAIIVSYRGTSDVQSFFQNFEFIQSPFFDNNNAKVHSGFLKTYKSTRDEITKLIKKLVSENPTYKVVVTGHSLGGALGVFQTLDLVGTPGLNSSNLFTYTYGEPRAGNQEFAKLVEKTGLKFSRVINKADIVPHLPPIKFNYEHYGPQFWIRPDNKVVECQGAEDPTCANSEKIPKINFIDHGIYFDTFFLLTCLNK